jgi:subtilisin family serine protease
MMPASQESLVMMPSHSQRKRLSAFRLAGPCLIALMLGFAPGLALAQTPPATGGAGQRGDAAGRAAPSTPSQAGTSPNRSMRLPPAVQPRQTRSIVPAMDESRFVPDEVLFELAPNAQAETVLRRYGATLIASQRFELAGVTVIRARLEAGRDVRAVLTQMADDSSIVGAQPNFLFELQQDGLKAGTAASPSGPAEATMASSDAGTKTPLPTLRLSDPATAGSRGSAAARRDLPPQYVVEKLRLGELHKLARGRAIRIAMIDSGVDMDHPELRGAIAGYLDALDGTAAPHAHGTAMAGAIVARAQLQGVAPAARLLAARAFGGGAAASSANGKTFQILAALDWAAQQRARVINLSFAGPQDRLLSYALAGAREQRMIAVAAAGNGGSRAAPLFPGADPNVISVTATDADDKIFPDANRGRYITVAAPGVDVLAAEPQGRYAYSSGTSIAAAHVSGLVALMLEKQPELDLDAVRKLLVESAVDLGPRGKDPVFGAGRIDAQAALARLLPVATAGP